jgi:hypothetical protein
MHDRHNDERRSSMTGDVLPRDAFVLENRVQDLEAALLDQRNLMQTFIQDLQKEYDALAVERNKLHSDLTDAQGRLQAIEADHTFWSGLKSADRLIELDFPVRPRVRPAIERGIPAVQRIIAAGQERYVDNLTRLAEVAERTLAIPDRAASPVGPEWVNDCMPALDGISIYGFLAINNPPNYVEIGSGNSTKFARQAIADFSLRTKIVSIDPLPRSEVAQICDQNIRSPLEDIALDLFYSLKSEDMVFCDNSHRAFQNSDVTVFLTEIVPGLSPGVLVGVQNIFLPYDYPAEWLTRFYNEQYLLACLLMGSDAFVIELPVYHCVQTEKLNRILDPIWGRLSSTVDRGGRSFWFRLKHRLEAMPSSDPPPDGASAGGPPGRRVDDELTVSAHEHPGTGR